MTTVASKVPFLDLCTLCEKISEKRGDDKKNQLKKFINTWREFHNKIHTTNPNTTDSFYPALRLLLPQYDRERKAYGIKENTLAKLYIEILCLNKDSEDSQKLLNYKSPINAQAVAGDFADVAYHVLKHRCPKVGSLTIAEVNADLDGVALSNAAKQKALVKNHLLHLLKNTTALEQKWLIRMIMKDLKMGMREQSILGVYHLDAKDLYDVTNDLAKVSLTLKDPNVRLHEIEVTLFSAFSPMLAARVPLSQISKQLEDLFYIETKLDGERFQLHKQLNEYKYYSRNAFDYTETFGANPQDGTLTPYIHRSFKAHVKSCILDGEVFGYNINERYIISKGENYDVKSLKNDSNCQVCICVFDVVMLNDKVLTNEPLQNRIKVINNLFEPIEGRIHLIDRRDAVNMDQVMRALNEAIDNNQEGIMLKNPSSLYVPRSRKGGWIKLKPEYQDSLSVQLDLLIIGGYFGEGHRSKIISHFMLGVAVPPSVEGEHPEIFYSFCRVGSGYTREELSELNKKFLHKWQPYNKKNPPKQLVLASGHKEKPDVWVDPSESCIVEIKAAEIIESDKFKTGYTLRFPRVTNIRYDKNWHECLTTDEMAEIKLQAKGKLTRGNIDLETLSEEIEPKRRKPAARMSTKPNLAPHFKGIDLNTVSKLTSLFEGKELCIINGKSNSGPDSKLELERLVCENGGTVVQNPLGTTYCVIANQRTLRVCTIMNSDKHDLIKSEWLNKCLQYQRIIPWSPVDYMHAKDNTVASLSKKYDRFGDHYTVKCDIEELKGLFKRISSDEISPIKPKEMAELEYDYFQNIPEGGIFRIFRIYLDKYVAVGDPSTELNPSDFDIMECELKYYGAKIEMNLNKVTHVVIFKRNLERLDEFKRLNRENEKKFHIVTEDWVEQSIKKKRALDEKFFFP